MIDLGLDFGTSNTHIGRRTDGSDTSQAVHLQGLGGTGQGLPTAVLSGNRRGLPCIGAPAIGEWSNVTPNEILNLNYKLSTNFKPDITRSQDALEASRVFLSTLRDCIGTTFGQAVDRLVIGVPCSDNDEYSTKIVKLLVELNFAKEVIPVPEPLGALYYHLVHGDIGAEQATQGVLVVDFGGGTCDFALVRRGCVDITWGDSTFGGRLFDDVFYQWYLEQSASRKGVTPTELEAQLEAERRLHFVREIKCKSAKEDFSNFVATRFENNEEYRSIPLQDVSIYRDTYMSNLTYEAFLARARDYTPSHALLNSVDTTTKTIVSDTKYKNLVNHYLHLLSSKSKEIEMAHVSTIIYTGGSSSWVFVREETNKFFQRLYNNPARIPRSIFSDRPHATIAEGLAVIPGFTDRLRNIPMEPTPSVSNDLTATKRGKAFDDLVSAIVLECERGVRAAIASIAMSSTDELVNQHSDKIRQLITGAEGKSRKETWQLVTDWMGKDPFAANRKRRYESAMLSIVQTIGGIVVDEVHSYLTHHHRIALKGLAISRKPLWRYTIDGLSVNPDKHIELVKTIALIGLVPTSSILAAMIAGGTGMALIAAGPIGLVAGSIIGAVIGAGAILGVEWSWLKKLGRVHVDDVAKHMKKIHHQNLSQLLTKFFDKSFVSQVVREQVKEHLELLDGICVFVGGKNKVK